eukprot:2952314-Rhodomonas_salina.1
MVGVALGKRQRASARVCRASQSTAAMNMNTKPEEARPARRSVLCPLFAHAYAAARRVASSVRGRIASGGTLESIVDQTDTRGCSAAKHALVA